jgi:5-methylcytosine-specific restriction enzyme A
MAHHDTGRWHHLYNTKRWKVRRAVQLAEHPFCELCPKEGLQNLATVADHVEPHDGDINAFHLGALQSLCTECHNRDKKRLELRGYGTVIDSHGWPTDPRHPSNKRRHAKQNVAIAR